MKQVLAALGIYLLAAAAYADPLLPRRASLGAGARPSEAGLEIVFVRPGSAAERAGLQLGDILVSIGGHSADAATFAQTVRASTPGSTLPLSVRRGGRRMTLTPQLEEAPREPASTGVDVVYEAVRVNGTLRRVITTVPASAPGQRPAVLVVGGIGCFSIDDATADDAYRHLAHDLSRRGFLVVRVEKSGIGDSQGPPCPETDFEQELAGYDAALRQMLADPRVDSRSVFVFGHSIGAIGAPELAARHPIAGLIVTQGVGRTWFEYDLINFRRQLELADVDPAQIDQSLLEKARCASRMLMLGEPLERIVASAPSCAPYLSYPASQRYMTQVAGRNIAELWSAVNADVLAIYGPSDFITDEPDHRRIVDLVNRRTPGRATLAILAELDHYLVRAPSPIASLQRMNAGGRGEYHAGLSELAGDWLCERARCDTSSR